MSTYVVAVSGGVDSVVLLDMLSKTSNEVIVAHFDHGIRPDSQSDAEFVGRLAEHYGYVFEMRREELGAGASEEHARDRRYLFLRSIAHKYGALLVTAHHADDVVESIAINLTRGTGWRGLAVLDSDVVRPLTNMNKSDIVDHAHAHGLEWREDSTNASDAYLRNRIRRKTQTMEDDGKRELRALRAQQVATKRDIYAEAKRLVGDGPEYSRYFFTCIDTAVAVECLYVAVHGRLTRPQLGRAVLAIKVHPVGTIFEAGGGVILRFTSRNFKVELIK